MVRPQFMAAFECAAADPAKAVQAMTTQEEAEGGAPKKSFGRRLTPYIALAAIALAAFLLYRTLSRYSWPEIVASVEAISAHRLFFAACFVAASYFCLTFFDYLGLRYAGRPLPYRKAALASFVALSMGHNIGLAALSTGAIRYRFYSRWGLSAGEVAKVVLFSAVTVALGLMTLGGAALIMRASLAEDITGIDRPLVIGLGVLCLALVAAYVALAALVRRPIRIRNFTLAMPPLKLAFGQIAIGPLNFACVAACLHQVLAAVGEVSYPAVATVYVLANVASLISHVPGGLGVIESVVLLLLPQANFIGALLVFRVLYFLVPLAIGGTTFAAIEIRRRQRKLRERGVH
jgi:glycosyltransferase 2 family protein